jgi:glycine/serine hydroxymethyltransferase
MRGMKEPEMAIIASIIVDVLTRPTDQGTFQGIRDWVRSLCDAFPLYGAAAT